MIERLSYSWGLYPRARRPAPTAPLVAVTWTASTLPPEVATAFDAERIAGLAGTFGDATDGDPVEIDDLDVGTDTVRVRIRVYNRGIGMVLGTGPELLHLHRFFSTVHAAAKR